MKKFDKVEEFKQSFLDEFVKSLEDENELIWKKGWNIVTHKNMISNTQYRGYNQLLLMFVSFMRDYNCCDWLTFEQAKKSNLHIKKGSKSTPIQFFSYYNKETNKNITYKEYLELYRNVETRDKVSYYLKYYNVFNASDIENYVSHKVENDINVIQNYIKKHNLKIKFGGNSAFCIPSQNIIVMPNKEQFICDYEYYSTLFHELAHSTENIIKRDMPNLNEDEKYAFEELIAETSCVLLCCEFGIEIKSIQNNKAYVKNWIEHLKNDKEVYLMKAIKNAEKITRYIIDNSK